MAQEKKDSWLQQMALATVLLAVCSTMSQFKVNAYSTQSVISQNLASDQWAFFQAKSTKLHLHELHLEQLRLQALALTPGSASAAAYTRSIAERQAKTAAYAREKTEIEANARALENESDEARRRSRPFSWAVIFLQVAVLLNSIAGLLKMRGLFWLAMPAGAVGFSFFATGWFLII